MLNSSVNYLNKNTSIIRSRQITLIKMKGSVQITSSAIIIILLLAVDRSEGDPRSQVLNLTCSQHCATSANFIPNFVHVMEEISTRIQTSHTATTVMGTGPDLIYALAECYGDLSPDDCMICYVVARTAIPVCLPCVGSQVFLDGCFIRTQNYNFFEENVGSNDIVICGNTTRYDVSLDSTMQVISDAARDAPKNRDYFARKVALSGTTNESTYVLADCWGTLNESSCKECLERASSSILQCLPWSEGRALHIGCFMRYFNTNFLNDDPTRGNNGGN
ncbi:unnamed protein product [Lactuca saligna]|uniref:Gnk2-homologous domain-containing protein n=1 Tax=Lactuca saligna TaxID=75948 RepID=A0AA35YJG7_LACSI|nr:unnamed protein product [Lactuca saligna]